MTGVTVGGFGLGSLIFTQVQTMYLNPGNIKPSSVNQTSQVNQTADNKE